MTNSAIHTASKKDTTDITSSQPATTDDKDTRDGKRGAPIAKIDGILEDILHQMAPGSAAESLLAANVPDGEADVECRQSMHVQDTKSRGSRQQASKDNSCKSGELAADSPTFKQKSRKKRSKKQRQANAQRESTHMSSSSTLADLPQHAGSKPQGEAQQKSTKKRHTTNRYRLEIPAQIYTRIKAKNVKLTFSAPIKNPCLIPADHFRNPMGWCHRLDYLPSPEVSDTEAQAHGLNAVISEQTELDEQEKLTIISDPVCLDLTAVTITDESVKTEIKRGEKQHMSDESKKPKRYSSLSPIKNVPTGSEFTATGLVIKKDVDDYKTTEKMRSEQIEQIQPPKKISLTTPWKQIVMAVPEILQEVRVGPSKLRMNISFSDASVVSAGSSVGTAVSVTLVPENLKDHIADVLKEKVRKHHKPKKGRKQI